MPGEAPECAGHRQSFGAVGALGAGVLDAVGVELARPGAQGDQSAGGGPFLDHLDDAGGTVLACTSNPGSRVDTRTGLPERVTAHAMSRTPIVHELAQIAAAGRRARWDLLQLLERITRAAVIKAHSRVSNEVAGPAGTSSRPTVLDETDLEVVVDTLLLGEDGGRSSPVNRMLDRCLRPDTFHRVDPLRYIVVTLRRDADPDPGAQRGSGPAFGQPVLREQLPVPGD